MVEVLRQYDPRQAPDADHDVHIASKVHEQIDQIRERKQREDVNSEKHFASAERIEKRRLNHLHKVAGGVADNYNHQVAEHHPLAGDVHRLPADRWRLHLGLRCKILVTLDWTGQKTQEEKYVIEVSDKGRPGEAFLGYIDYDMQDSEQNIRQSHNGEGEAEGWDR